MSLLTKNMYIYTKSECLIVLCGTDTGLIFNKLHSNWTLNNNCLRCFHCVLYFRIYLQENSYIKIQENNFNKMESASQSKSTFSGSMSTIIKKETCFIVFWHKNI